jgi:hypothetical protein
VAAVAAVGRSGKEGVTMARRLNLKSAPPGRPLKGPSTQATRWRRRLLGALRFLDNMPEGREWPLDKWTAGMRLHYRENVYFLLSHPPKGCGPEAKRYAAHWKKMLDSQVPNQRT